MSLKAEIGKKVGPYRDEVTPDRVASFCAAIGVKNCSMAPPTFLTVFRKGEFELFQVLGIELSKILHTDQEYQYEKPVYPGDLIRFETSLSNVLEKQGSSFKIQFLTLETEFYSDRELNTYRIGKSKTTIVVRDQV